MKTYDEARTGAVLRARDLRRNATEAEKHLLHALRTGLPQFKWRPQMPVGPYFADVACFAEKLIVELDGGHHTISAEYDEIRTRFLRQRGYRVLRFWNNEVLENVAGVLERIAQGLSTSLSRGCERRAQAVRGTAAHDAHPSPMGEGGSSRRLRKGEVESFSTQRVRP